ncbi:trichothecene C-15 hydroxylase [Lasiosphaeris hirsuta]|uniref:Trichothecene C-15 hydroxylase n=1 Tax=Lasiosphaeris hirsuta TaxID=260670 RepID=A0AA39ZSD7_9PEZI|nr:trichothecene C-15 hydroxylase [Lasiosphaeris hirsuta]
MSTFQSTLSLLLLATFILYRIYIIVRNVWFHPLSKVPGPKLYAASWIPKVWNNNVRGKHWVDLKYLHEKYGNVVRVGPDEVSCSSAQGWNDIAGHKTGGKRDFPRDLNFLELQQMDTRGSIISPVKEEHRMFRRLIQPGFSESALTAQEPVILEYGDHFVASLRRRCATGPIDLERTFVWTTFDMMGELAFGEGFGCLKTDSTHRFIRLMETSAQPLALLQALHRFEVGKLIERITVSLPFLRRWFETQVISFDKVTARFERIKTDPHLRKDVMSLIWRDAQADSAPISHHQAAQLANLLCLTGAETASTTLAGLSYWLLCTPHAQKRLVDEIRGSFAREEDITMRSIAQLPYLKACIQEGLRKHTFLSGPIPRVSPKGGDWVEGYFLPEGTICGVPHWASGHLARNFGQYDSYLPERWLSGAENDPRFAHDSKGASQPFGKGAMDCIGRTLALTQLRLMMVKLFWNFDVELRPESQKWVSHEEAKCTLFREKAPLWVNVRPVERDNTL